MLKCSQQDEGKGQQRAFSGGLTPGAEKELQETICALIVCQRYLNEPSPDESVKAHSSSRGATLTEITEFSEKNITHMQQAGTSAQPCFCRWLFPLDLLTMKFLRGGHSSG